MKSDVNGVSVIGQLGDDVEFALAVVVVEAHVVEGDRVEDDEVGALLEAGGPKTNLDTFTRAETGLVCFICGLQTPIALALLPKLV